MRLKYRQWSPSKHDDVTNRFVDRSEVRATFEDRSEVMDVIFNNMTDDRYQVIQLLKIGDIGSLQ